jgi:hypothetical protein
MNPNVCRETGRFLPVHGMKGEKLYGVFADMLERCTKPNSPKWKDYGGRGIFICHEWLEDRTLFFSWAKSSGYREGLQIDREDNDGPYSPDNCRWVTARVNSRNRRSSRLTEQTAGEIKHLLLKGYSLAVIADKYGICFQTVHCIKQGKAWPEIQPSALVDEYPPVKTKHTISAHDHAINMVKKRVEKYGQTPRKLAVSESG